MSQEQETDLLNKAVYVIANNRLGPHMVQHFDPQEFWLNYGAKVKAYVDGLKDMGKVVQIALVSIGPASKSLRKVSITEIESDNCFFKWDGSNTAQILIRMAQSVLAAAIYEILATKRWIALYERDPKQAEGARYVPTLDMRAFVAQQKLPRL